MKLSIPVPFGDDPWLTRDLLGNLTADAIAADLGLPAGSIELDPPEIEGDPFQCLTFPPFAPPAFNYEYTPLKPHPPPSPPLPPPLPTWAEAEEPSSPVCTGSDAAVAEEGEARRRLAGHPLLRRLRGDPRLLSKAPGPPCLPMPHVVSIVPGVPCEESTSLGSCARDFGC